MRVGRSGLVVKKMGMTTLFLDSGEACPVTLFSLEGCSVISSKKDADKDYISIQVGSGVAKKVNKPLSSFFSKLGVVPRKVLKEFRVLPEFDLPGGTSFSADYFDVGSYIDVSGITIGRGFAGPMKRHNFSGLRATHGVSVSHRSHGSTGHRKDPAKVFKGKKMAGHMGCKKITVQNLKVMDHDIERGIIVVKGCVPGFDGAWVTMADAIKKPLKKSAS